jgi:hypothetical protein
MTTNNTEIIEVPSELFTTWELSMLIIAIACLGIFIFISIVIYNYVHRFDFDDDLHR